MTLHALLAVVGFALLPLTEEERIENVIRYLRGKGSKAELHVVTPDIRDAVIEQLKLYASGKHPKSNQYSKDPDDYTMLLRLGDERTIRWVANIYQERHAAGIGYDFSPEMERSAQPALVPLLAPNFFLDDGSDVVWKSDEDIAYQVRPFSIYSAHIALQIISKSESIAPSVREWAIDINAHIDNDPTIGRNILREWWRANEHFFAEKNYKAVRPGREMPQPKGELAASAIPEEPATHIAVPTAIPAFPSGEISKRPADATTFTWMIWTAAGTALAATIIIVLFRTTPRSRN